jgi:uncharacterized membrane protein YqiK
MKIKLSEINRLSSGSVLKEQILVVILAIFLGVITWYFVTNSSQTLVIPKSKSGKKSCDFN